MALSAENFESVKSKGTYHIQGSFYKIISECLSRISAAQSTGMIALKALKKKKKNKTCQSRFLYPAKLLFKSGEIETDPGKQKLKEFIAIRPG